MNFSQESCKVIDERLDMFKEKMQDHESSVERRLSQIEGSFTERISKFHVDDERFKNNFEALKSNVASIEAYLNQVKGALKLIAIACCVINFLVTLLLELMWKRV